jgi:hypothetical protein
MSSARSSRSPARTSPHGAAMASSWATVCANWRARVRYCSPSDSRIGCAPSPAPRGAVAWPVLVGGEGRFERLAQAGQDRVLRRRARAGGRPPPSCAAPGFPRSVLLTSSWYSASAFARSASASRIAGVVLAAPQPRAGSGRRPCRLRRPTRCPRTGGPPRGPASRAAVPRARRAGPRRAPPARAGTTSGCSSTGRACCWRLFHGVRQVGIGWIVRQLHAACRPAHRRAGSAPRAPPPPRAAS